MVTEWRPDKWVRSWKQQLQGNWDQRPASSSSLAWLSWGKGSRSQVFPEYWAKSWREPVGKVISLQTVPSPQKSCNGLWLFCPASPSLWDNIGQESHNRDTSVWGKMTMTLQFRGSTLPYMTGSILMVVTATFTFDLLPGDNLPTAEWHAQYRTASE
jgi:hypothetical protein